jgi:hypothetical protein
MEVQFVCEMEDIEEVTISELKSRYPSTGRMRKLCFLLGLAIPLLPFLVATDFRHPDLSLWWTLPLGIGLLISAIVSTPRRWARKYYADKCAEREECKATISEEGITMSTPMVHTELRWAAFSRCIEGNGVLALVHSGIMYVFPQRAFTEEQWKEFHGLVQRLVPRPK